MLIETKNISEETKTYLQNLTPKQLEKKYKNGDYLYMCGLVFVMVSYSEETDEGGQQSRWVSYWSELHNLQIDTDYTEQTVEIFIPSVDWRKSGF